MRTACSGTSSSSHRCRSSGSHMTSTSSITDRMITNPKPPTSLLDLGQGARVEARPIVHTSTVRLSGATTETYNDIFTCLDRARARRHWCTLLRRRDGCHRPARRRSPTAPPTSRRCSAPTSRTPACGESAARSGRPARVFIGPPPASAEATSARIENTRFRPVISNTRCTRGCAPATTNSQVRLARTLQQTDENAQPRTVNVLGPAQIHHQSFDAAGEQRERRVLHLLAVGDVHLPLERQHRAVLSGFPGINVE